MKSGTNTDQAGEPETQKQEPKWHYGDMTVIRPSRVAYAKDRKAAVLRYALTDQHPAYRQFVDEWNGLTTAEMLLVGDIWPAKGYCNGFVEAPAQIEEEATQP